MKQRKLRMRAVIFTTASAAALALSGAAGAQDEAGGRGADEDSTDAIFVVGERRAKSLQDTTASVNVVTSELLEEQNITRVFDALSLVGNVSPPGRPNEGFSIRGVNSEGVSGPTGGLPVSTIYIDNAPQSFQGARRGALNSWDVEQIEVFRGPQSTNQGRNALAGAIYIKTKDPTYDWEAAGRFQYGSHDFKSVAAALSGPLLENQLAFRLSGEWTEQDSTIEVIGQSEEPFERDFFNVRGKLLFEPEALPDLSVKFTGFAGEDKPGSRAVTGPDLGAEIYDSSQTFNEIEQEGVKFDGYILDASYDVTDAFKVLSITSFQNTESSEIASGGDLDINAGSEVSEFTEDFRLIYNGDRFGGLLGLFYAQADVETFFLAEGFFAVFPDYVPFVRQDDRGESSRETLAVFGEGTFDISPSWAVTLGARYETEDFENRSRTETFLDPDLFGFGSIETLNEQTDFDAFIPKGVLTWRPTDNINISATVAKGYRGGGVSSAPLLGVRPFDPESTWTYELAWRSTFLDGDLIFNANAFYTDWRDQQVALSPVGNAQSAVIVNAGESELYGIEADLIWRVTEEISVVSSAGYVSTEFTDFTAPDGFFLDGFTQNLVGNEFVRAPNVTAATAVNWRSEATGLFANANIRYTGERFQDAENLIGLDDTIVVNARAGWANEKVSVYVFGNNVFDETVLAFDFVDLDNWGELNQDQLFGFGIEFSY